MGKQLEMGMSVKFIGSGSYDSERWQCNDLPGSSAQFEWSSYGAPADNDEKRWGWWALVLSNETPRPSRQSVDELAEKWVAAKKNAAGFQGDMQVERDDWDEARLRALCDRHGWEFEWMTEDGERKRRANERQAFFRDAGELAGVRQVVEAVAKAQEINDANSLLVDAKVQESG